MKVLILDNYDSFTYNLAQALEELGGNPEVYKNDELTLEEFFAKKPTHIIISPGPGTAEKSEDIGICREVVETVIRELPVVPILGVCLGHQLIGSIFGAKIIHAPEIMHGKVSQIVLTPEGGKSLLFKKVPEKLNAMRYHSLMIQEKKLSPEIAITARSSGVIMAIEHKKLPIFGVQFHPESFATPEGKRMLSNFLTT
jgi:anthranilate synthase/aminodeoxychorismate synthase-like glutamine amidotransferase